jgi:hypothetical protein
VNDSVRTALIMNSPFLAFREKAIRATNPMNDLEHRSIDARVKSVDEIPLALPARALGAAIKATLSSRKPLFPAKIAKMPERGSPKTVLSATQSGMLPYIMEKR